MTIGNEALAEVTRFCEQRTPPICVTSSGSSARLAAARSRLSSDARPWNPALGTDWSTSAIAQLRRDARGAWSLHWRSSDARWHLYEEVQPSRDVGPLLAEIDADPTGIFWG